MASSNGIDGVDTIGNTECATTPGISGPSFWKVVESASGEQREVTGVVLTDATPDNTWKLSGGSALLSTKDGHFMNATFRGDDVDLFEFDIPNATVNGLVLPPVDS